jgi:predicted lipase
MPRRVTCTGYSLGGSLASLAACWASYTLATADVRCITFGALRVGNIDFRSAFENMVGTKYRVVFQHDPVPHALDKRLLYAHAGSVIWISDGKLCWKVRPNACLACLVTILPQKV